MNTPATDQIPEPFSIVAGGPFHAVLGRLGLLGADGLPELRAAVGLAILAWLLPALSAVAQGLIDDRHLVWAYFRDVTVYALWWRSRS